MTERFEILSESQWLELRQPDFTASVIGALFKCHPNVTAMRLWAEKRGLEMPHNSDDEFLAARRDEEPAIARAVGRQYPQWSIEANAVYLRDPVARLGCTIDFHVLDPLRGHGILEAKTANPGAYERHWNNGETIPLYILLQVTVQRMLADASFAVVAVKRLDSHQPRVKVIEVPRSAAVEDKIRVAVADFWDCVESGKEPEPEYASDAAVFKALWPRETLGKVVDLSGNNELPDMLARRAALLAGANEMKDRVDRINAEIIHMLGDAERVTGVDGWSITYKTRKGYTPKPVEPARILRITENKGADDL